jgi:hypothetical protein
VHYPHSYFSFLPGFPWLLRYPSPPGVEVRWTGLVPVTLCGAESAVLLCWLALDMTGLHTAAQWSVIAYAWARLTVFFSVVYSEATFTASALGAWLAGRKQQCRFPLSGDSSPRYLHAVFPLYVLLGAWLAGHGPALRAVWVGVSSALAVVWAMQWWLA